MRALFFTCILFPIFLSATLSLDRDIQSECVVLINASTGKVLFAKNPDQPVYPASTTKIATAFYALMQKPNGLKEAVIAPKEALITVSPSEKIQANYSKCPSFWLESDGSHVGIKSGHVLTLEELLYGTMISSGNDASNIIAHHVSGKIQTFVEDMNRFVKNLGCQNTHFCNPHGLHHPEHITTARDMARLAQCAMYHPVFRKAVAMKKYERQATATQPRLLFVQTNKMLLPGKHYYPEAIGIKTGYTSKAGHSVVVAAQKGDRTLIAAIYKSKDKDARFYDARALFDACFKEVKVEKLLLAAGPQAFSQLYDGAESEVQTYTKEPIRLEYYPSEEPEIRSLLTWDFVPLPIKEGTKVGQITILADEKEHTIVPLFAKNEVKETLSAKMNRLAHTVVEHWIIALSLFALVIVGYSLVRRR